jgi:predicted Rossmann-fold nucleotide-binding protein
MQKNLRLIVCGGRQYSDGQTIWTALDKIHSEHGISQIICGGAPGSDDYVSKWAKTNGVAVTIVLAEWQKHGHAAGPKRNQKMLELKPDGVVAFPGGAGTADMCRLAREAGLKIWEPAAEQP